MQFPQRSSAPRFAGLSGGLSRAAVSRAATVVLFWTLFWTASQAYGDPACVHFDVPQLVACRWLDTPDGVENEQGKYIEAEFDVSTLLRFGHESQVKQLLFVIESPAGTLRVTDYAPRTELTSLYAGPIEQDRTQERSLNGGLNATFSPLESINARANASQGKKTSERLRYRTLPPMQLLAASGTISRGTAVYFKFISTPQTTLDGSRQVRAVFRVPKTWRADYVYFRCAAFGESTDQHTRICGSTDFLVPLHLEGDESAVEAARQMARSESTLRHLARQLRSENDWGRSDSLGDKLKAMFREPPPRVPELWLTTVLTSQPNQRDFSFQGRLPQELNQALAQFTRDRQQVFDLNH